MLSGISTLEIKRKTSVQRREKKKIHRSCQARSGSVPTFSKRTFSFASHWFNVRPTVMLRAIEGGRREFNTVKERQWMECMGKIARGRNWGRGGIKRHEIGKKRSWKVMLGAKKGGRKAGTEKQRQRGEWRRKIVKERNSVGNRGMKRETIETWGDGKKLIKMWRSR